MQNASLLPGEKVQMHFRSEGPMPSFNITGEIVNKKYVKSLTNQFSPVPYAVKFVDMNLAVDACIKKFFKNIEEKRSA